MCPVKKNAFFFSKFNLNFYLNFNLKFNLNLLYSNLLKSKNQKASMMANL